MHVQFDPQPASYWLPAQFGFCQVSHSTTTLLLPTYSASTRLLKVESRLCNLHVRPQRKCDSQPYLILGREREIDSWLTQQMLCSTWYTTSTAIALPQPF